MTGTATRFGEAEAALVTLEQAILRAPNSLVERDGAIFRLIYTFAAVCKACQRLLAEREHIKARTPDAAIRGAMRLGWLSGEDAEAAIAAGRDREFAFQMYRAGIGDEIAKRLPSHATVLRRWLDALQQRATGN